MGHPVARLAAVDRGEFERAVKVGVRMGEIDPATERDEVGARRVALGRVGGPDECVVVEDVGVRMLPGEWYWSQ